MSSQTIDNVVFEKTQETDVTEKPFLKRDWIFISDQNNSGLYSQNQVVFDSTSLSSNGRYVDYSQGVISFPQVITVSASGGTGVDWTNTTSMNDTILSLKNSHYNLIHSCTIEYANGTVVEQKPYLNQYINFKLNTELSQMDEELFGSQIGYAKDSSDSYFYGIANNSRGQGLCNNTAFQQGINPHSNIGAGDLANNGFVKRMKYMDKVSYNGKHTLLVGPQPTTETGASREIADFRYMQNTGANTIVNTTTNKVYYYDCMVRLKDISDFFGKMPLVRGAVIKITLVLNNNISFQVLKDSAGSISLLQGSFQNVSSLTNPLMLSSSTIQFNMPTLSPSNLVSADSAAFFVAGGLTTIPINTTLTVSSALCINGNFRHVKTNCRLYVPVHIMNADFEKLYLTNSQRNIEYTDLEYFFFRVSSGQQFINVLTNGTSRMKRLIIIAHLASSGNGNGSEISATNVISPMSSPFWDGTVSPHIIKNFNVSLAGNNIYPNLLQYSYEQFWNEMNSQQGLNAGLVNGLSSGRINLQDYQNNYKYYVVDLSRRLPQDENVPQSVTVSGELTSGKDIEFFCFIEKSKNVLVDVSNGMRL